MKIFLSYRRDDTGGRAGRLYDALAQKYGRHRVFQDVSSASPGLDFTARIESTIADSDAVLVVIGPNWLSSASEGGRRIDKSDDFVRREISAALATTKPVVPVLVDGAALPSPDQLPDELAGLVNRQAVTLRDASWHLDVDGLIRQLEGAELPIGRPRRTGWIIAGAVAAIAVIATVVMLTNDDGDDGDDTSSEVEECPEIDATFTELELSDAPPTEWIYQTNNGEVIPVGAWFRPDGVGWDVGVEVKTTNLTEPDGDDDGFYFGVGDVDGMVVGGSDQGSAVCFGRTIGDQQLDPGENVTVLMGFESRVNPTDAAIVLEVFDDLDMPVVTP